MRKTRKNLRYYPLAVNLDKRLTVVIGGGAIAERKVDGLLETGARIKVVSPKATPLLKRLAGNGSIEWVRRRARSSDIRGARIIVAATNNTVTNRRVSCWAQRYGIWVNVVDRPVLSDFISPAVFRAAEGIITVYTDGKNPKLSRDIKNFLKDRWDDFLSYRHRLQDSSA